MSSFAYEIIRKNQERPDHIALIDRAGTRETRWSEMFEDIRKVSAYACREKLAGIVPVCMDRGLEAITTLLGLNLAGVGVAPLSVTTPESRCQWISEKVKNTVWTEETWKKVCDPAGKENCGTEAAEKTDAADLRQMFSDSENGDCRLTDRDPAYVVFTSGSTGTPKGVLLNNEAILDGMYRAAGPGFFDYREDTRVLQCSSLSFIAFAADALAALLCGSRVYILPETARGDIRLITDFVNRFGINCFFISPQLLREFEGAPSLKRVCTGGDRIVNLGPKGYTLISVYGQTESGGFTFSYEIREPLASTPLGFPCGKVQAYVLDEEGKPAEEGELCLSGPVADGYLDLPEQTAAAFTENPFSDDPEQRILMHTGDIVQKIPEGYRYLNRKDNMLKINGQRVEPGEIEKVLTELDGIDVSVVRGFTDEHQRSILCAYYTGVSELPEEKMEQYLASRLPHYMVPAVYIHLEKMPLNSNGKLDRKALPEPDFESFRSRYEAPRNRAEEELCAAFEKVLGLEHISRNDDFFRMGGDSIRVLQAVKECGDLALSTGDVFAGRTPASIALLADGKHTGAYENLPADLAKAPLTGSQMGILLDSDPNEKSTVYNIPVRMSFPVTADMTEVRVKEAVDAVLRVHPALYSAIEEENGQYFMVRRPFPAEGICILHSCETQSGEKLCTEEKCSGGPASGEVLPAAVEAFRKNFIHPIAPGKDPLCEASAILAGDRVHVFLNMHHIVSDGTGVAILSRQLEDAFAGKLPEAEKTDAFALAEVEDRLRKEGQEAAKNYYEHLLSGVETDSSLTADHRAEEGSRRPAGHIAEEIRLPELENLTEKTEITESTFFMGVFGYTLAKMTGQEESLFTAAENGRGSNALQDTVSMLVKTLPVYMKINEEESAAALLRTLQAQFYATMRNDCIPFGDLAKEYGVRSDLMFVYQADMLSGRNADTGRVTMETCPLEESLSNLSVQILKTAGSYRMAVDYRKDLYDERTVQAFVSLFVRAAEHFVKERPLRELELISAEDREFLRRLNAGGDTEIPDETPVDLFRRAAKRLPGKNAVCYRDRKYTYAETDEITDRIAAYLASKGIGRDSVVSVLIPRNEYIVLASFGVLKSGAAYQPLDPAYPEERLQFMVTDSKAAFLIADRNLKKLLPGFTGPVLYTDEIPGLPAAGHIPEAPKPEDLFILLYTSGTTGTPKGCMLSHRNLRSFIPAYVKNLQLTEDCLVANYASYGFDAHMADVYPCLTTGATLTVIPDELRLDLPAVRDFCVEHKVTHLMMTTQVARQFAVQYPSLEGLRCLGTGGEKLVSLKAPEYRFMNMYGPTESTVCVTAFCVDDYYENIPIGMPMLNCHIRVLDRYGRQVPLGVPGELVVFGPQVGMGYLNREEQTAKSFITSEEEEEKFRRGYRTGDVVRFLADGNIEFIGRRDHQVKIRGFRIELGEVERAVREYPGITDATVTVLDSQGTKRLCAYVVSGETVDAESLSSFIAESHPAYMVPSVIMQIDTIPLNVNGKVDKKKLPVPEMRFEDGTKPETDLQKKIFGCVSEAVGTGDFGIHTDIFAAGLSSIGSIRLCSLLADEFDISVQIRDLKKHPTVAKLEEFIQASAANMTEGTLSAPDPGTAGADNALTEEDTFSGKKTVTEDYKKSGAESTPEEKRISDEAADSGRKASAKTEKTYGPACPITKTMEGIFAECIGRPESTVYNIPYLLKLGSGVDEKRLKRALAAAVEAHASMKTEIYTDIGGNILQHCPENDPYTEADIDDLQLTDMAALLNTPEKLVRPFELTGSRLFEIRLIHGDGLYLFINIHHIIADGTSMNVFLSDVEKAYAGECLQPEKYTAFDVAAAERKARNGADLQDAKDYYDTLLDGLDKDFLPLPDKYEAMTPSSGKLSFSGRLVTVEEVKRYCEAHRLSANAFFTSVFGLVLARYAGSDYSVFNTVYNGRNDSRTARTVGMLVKTLPVVCRADAETVQELTSGMAAQLMDSMVNDLYSYGEISRAHGIKNDVMFIFQGGDFERKTFCGEPAEERALTLSEAKAAWTMQVFLQDGVFRYELEYDPKRFTEALALAFVQAYDCAAASFMKAEKCREVKLLSAEAEEEMERFNRTETDYDRSRTITGSFLLSASRDPEHLCVAYKDCQLTFGGVEDLTGRIAYHLMKEGIGRGDVVSILINRDENMVLCAHGAVRTGAAYLGLDPTYPADRLKFMIGDSGSGYLLADRSLMNLVKDYEGKVLYTDEIASLPRPDEEEMKALLSEEKHQITPENDALVIYSSGTTGVPKGSVLQHKAIVCFCENYSRHYCIGSESRVATYASFGFDGGAMDVFCAPMQGAALYVIPDEIRMDLAELEKFYTRNAITNGFMTTQVGCMFIAATKCRSLKHFMVGGEKLIPVTGPDWVHFTNGYGPSETMCYVNRFEVKTREKLQPIGKVSENTREYVIDRYGNRQPYGACGELCISGGQMGRGYLNRPEKTAEVFVENPFCHYGASGQKAGESAAGSPENISAGADAVVRNNRPAACYTEEYRKMYRTGDIVRMLPDGNYDFVGRRDGQVKIRGFRVELPEVEQQIRKFPGVEKAVVQAFDNPAGGKSLAAYVAAEGELDQEALRNFIASEKPDYMIPAVIMQVEDIPLTSNGKVDMKKLPKPEQTAVRKGKEPSDEMEEKICHIFEEVLGLPKVYADDDYFAIGGTSISAIQVVVKCEQAGFPVVYKNLFANATAQKLAAWLRGSRQEDVMAGDLESGDGHDYSALNYNVPENLPEIRDLGVGDVLLTGVTGFLGSHLYKELMESTDAKVICLVRSKEGLDAETRFEMIMTYYFEDWYSEEKRRRTLVVDGELEDDDIREKLVFMRFDTIINCAANVKHFAAGDELLKSNFSGVENLVALAEETKAKLIQISSLSVCGESVNGSVPLDFIFRENNLNIGQSLENKYVYSKYLGEQAVIDAVSRGRIRGKVIRLGNLMARSSDSEFQVNAGTNGLIRMFMGFRKLGCYPVGMLDAPIEFSPIDYVAKAVLLLSGTPDGFTVFHAKNCNTIHYGYLLSAMKKAGFSIEIVNDEEFERRLNLALEDEGNAEVLGGLLAYRNDAKSTMSDSAHYTGNNTEKKETRVKIASDTSFTVKALYRLGFAWPLISEEYLDEMVQTLIGLGFFER